jgi:hypothetical protein
MKETTAQYVKRIQGYVAGKDPLKIQQTTAKKLQKLIKPLGKKRLRHRPAPAKWSIAEILAHLADSEIVASWRMRAILASDGAPIQGFDQEAWAKTFGYNERDPRESLKMFRLLREHNLSLLRSVPRKLWQNHGVHSERGKETVTTIVKLFAGHDVNHLLQVERIAKASRR